MSSSAKTVRGALEELADITRRVDAGEPICAPDVRLALLHGHTVTGRLRALGTMDAECTIELDTLDSSSGRRSTDRTYVPLSAVVAVTVLDATRVAERDPQAPPPPGRLELSRIAMRIYERLTAAKLGVKLELPKPMLDEDLDALGTMLSSLDCVLTALLEEPIAKEALGKVEVLRLHVDAAPAIHRDKGLVVVTEARAFSGRRDAATLQHTLESVL